MEYLPTKDRLELVENIEKIAKSADERGKLVATISHNIEKDGLINRHAFTALPSEVSREVMVYWLRRQKILQFDQRTIERLSLALKVARPNTTHNIGGRTKLLVHAKTAHFDTSD